jgi:hypothetical protein
MARRPPTGQASLPGVDAPTSAKASYVKAQRQTRNHECHWPGCGRQVRPAMWGCTPHWFRLPPDLRRRIWETYRPGQEKDMRPSENYMKVASEVQDWIRRFGGPP